LDTDRLASIWRFLGSKWGWAYALAGALPGIAVAATFTGGAVLPAYWAACGLLSIAVWISIPVLLGRDAAATGTLMRGTALACTPLLGLILADVSYVYVWITVPGWYTLKAISVGVAVVLLVAAVSEALPRAHPLLLTLVRHPRAALLIAAIWAALFGALSCIKWWTMESPQSQDLAIHEQALFNTTEGRFLEYTTDFRAAGVPHHRFGDHFEPTLLLFLPLYALFRTPLVLLLGQAAIVASGAVALGAIARRVLSIDEAGIAFALLYLLHPGPQEAVMTEFHVGVLAAPLILWGMATAMQGRNWAMTTFFILALGCKENIGLTVAVVGLFIGWLGYCRREGAVALCALAWTAIAVYAVVPHFSATGGYQYSAELLAVGGLGGASTWGSFARRCFDYLLVLLGPVGLVSIFAPLALLVSLPEYTLHVLSGNPSMTTMMAHYHVTIIVGIMMGAVYGVRFLGTGIGRRWLVDDPQGKQGGVSRVLLGVVVAGAVFWLQQGYLCRAEVLVHGLSEAAPAEIRRLIDEIPDGAPVICESGAIANHLARRRWLAVASTNGLLDDGWYSELRDDIYVIVSGTEWDDALLLPFALRPRQKLGVGGVYTFWRVQGLQADEGTTGSRQ
jgi:uncharacterized membrane protein